MNSVRDITGDFAVVNNVSGIVYLGAVTTWHANVIGEGQGEEITLLFTPDGARRLAKILMSSATEADKEVSEVR